MEELPAIPNDALWQQADEALDTDDPLDSRLAGIQSILVAWRAKGLNSVPDSELSSDLRQDRNDIQLWLFGELKDFFLELSNSRRMCRLTIGNSDARGHRLGRLGSEYALFESGLLASGSSFTLNYAEKHGVPQAAVFDQAPGLMGAQQVYVGDTGAGMAISIRQLAMTLRDNGQLNLL